MGELRWAPKKDRTGAVIPRCWLTECGFTVAEFRIGDGEVVTLAVTRPGESAPFAYCGSRSQVVDIITADKAATAALEQA